MLRGVHAGSEGGVALNYVGLYQAILGGSGFSREHCALGPRKIGKASDEAGGEKLLFVWF